MDNHYNIKRNQKPLSDEQINKHKDFGKLLQNTNKITNYKQLVRKPFYKNWGLYSFIIAAAVVALVIIIDKEEDKSNTISKIEIDTTIEKQKTDTSSDISIIPDKSNSSFTENSVTKNTTRNSSSDSQYSIFEINSSEGSIIYNSDSTRIIVPPDAFQNIKNNIIFVKYRDAKKMVLPSLYDSISKSKKNIISEIAFEILFSDSKNNQPLYLKKPVVVELINKNHSSLNYYYYNSTNNSIQFYSYENLLYRFIINASDSEFPELLHITNLVWEFNSNQIKDISAVGYIFSKPWKYFSLTDNNKQVKLKNTNSSFLSIAKPTKLHQDDYKNNLLLNSFYNYLNPTDEDKERIAKWKKQEGETYSIWNHSKKGEHQILSTYSVNTVEINKPGIFVLGNTAIVNKPSFKEYKRIITLSKNTQKNELFSDELIKKQPGLRRE